MGANMKAKANMVPAIGELIQIAMDKGEYPDYNEKHGSKAKFGWYRYNARFGLPVYDESGNLERYNIFTTRMLVRCDKDGKLYLYDLVRTKNLGYLYENVTAQILAANGNELFYHTFLNEKSRHNYEIDFLVTRKNKICPIEVKSSGYKTHASLDAFMEKFSDRILQRYLLYTKDLRKDGDILCVPIYMT